MTWTNNSVEIWGTFYAFALTLQNSFDGTGETREGKPVLSVWSGHPYSHPISCYCAKYFKVNGFFRLLYTRPNVRCWQFSAFGIIIKHSFDMRSTESPSRLVRGLDDNGMVFPSTICPLLRLSLSVEHTKTVRTISFDLKADSIGKSH